MQHSTVSRRLRSLEAKLQTRLIERKPSGYELTEAGEELKHSAGKIEAEVLAFEGALGGQESGIAGELRVSAINNMASSVLMPVFARFSATYPEIELHVQVSNKFIRLAERDADIAIRLTNAPTDTLIGTRLPICCLRSHLGARMTSSPHANSGRFVRMTSMHSTSLAARASSRARPANSAISTSGLRPAGLNS